MCVWLDLSDMSVRTHYSGTKNRFVLIYVVWCVEGGGGCRGCVLGGTVQTCCLLFGDFGQLYFANYIIRTQCEIILDFGYNYLK